MKKQSNLVILTEKDLTGVFEDELMGIVHRILDELRNATKEVNINELVYLNAGRAVRNIHYRYSNVQEENHYVIIEKPQKEEYVPITHEGYLSLMAQLTEKYIFDIDEICKQTSFSLSEYIMKVEIPIVENKIQQATKNNDGYLLMFREQQLKFLKKFI